jgi:hypothetical protein
VIYTFCPVVSDRPVNVKAPVAEAVVVLIIAPSTKRVTVLLGSPVPPMVLVPGVNDTGEVIVGVVEVPARLLDVPLPVARQKNTGSDMHPLAFL